MTKTRFQFLRFLAGGVANTAATYGLFVAMSQVIPPSIAYTITYIIGIGLSYLINTQLVFKTQGSLRSALQFPVVYLVQYFIGLAVLALLTSLDIPTYLAMLAVIAINVPLTFVLTRFVLRNPQGRTS